MPKNSVNVSLNSYDDIFSTEESRQEEQREQVQQIPIRELFPFKNHPFKVLDDEAMQRTVESVAQYGVLAPLIARPRPEGGYEIISGHRRQHAAELAGLETLPVIVREMSDDGNLHGLPDPAWLRLRCHAALNPVFIHPQGCDRIPKINYHHELSKARCRKRSGLLHIRMEVRTWNRIGSSNAETSIL